MKNFMRIAGIAAVFVLVAGLATWAKAKSAGYVIRKSFIGNVMSTNPDGSVGISTITQWAYTVKGGADAVTVQLTYGQNALNLSEVGRRGTLFVPGVLVDGKNGRYFIHFKVVKVDLLKYSDEAFAAGKFNSYYQSGKGPAIILVGGASEQHAMDSETAQLASQPLLAQHFTVLHYDRRGRGDSTDTQPYAVEREIEDIEALIDEVGGSAFLFGISSGAALALEAALKLGGKIRKLAMYEAPYNSAGAARQAWRQYRKQLKELLAAGRRGEAVGLFMMLVGMPAEHLDGMRRHPMWPMWEAVAPTLAYDAAVLGDEASVPTERAAGVAVPTLIMDGGASYPFMHETATALAGAIPNARQRTLEGQTHEAAAEAIAPVLAEFFDSKAAVGRP